MDDKEHPSKCQQVSVLVVDLLVLLSGLTTCTAAVPRFTPRLGGCPGARSVNVTCIRLCTVVLPGKYSVVYWPT